MIAAQNVFLQQDVMPKKIRVVPLLMTEKIGKNQSFLVTQLVRQIVPSVWTTEIISKEIEHKYFQNEYFRKLFF